MKLIFNPSSRVIANIVADARKIGFVPDDVIPEPPVPQPRIRWE